MQASASKGEETEQVSHHWSVIVLLIFAGDIIFSLPFHVTRFYRPTLLDAFSLSNTQLGDIFAMYGIAATVAYFPGGMLADRLSPRRLISFSLLATGLGGIYFASFPSLTGLYLLYAYFGVTTILLFWAAMIKTTREWGGVYSQGKAFGFLDGGRGLVAASAAAIGVVILGHYLGNDGDYTTTAQRQSAIAAVIYYYSGLTVFAAALAWFVLPESDPRAGMRSSPVFSGLGQVLRRRSLWLQAVIVICAYCAYKGIDNYSLYAVTVLGMNELEAAEFTAIASYVRPVAAVGAGLLADRVSARYFIVAGFALLVASYSLLAFIDAGEAMTTAVSLNLIVTMFGVFGVRGVYFSLMEESRTDRRYAGTAAGAISLVGFTPDIFFGTVTGRILDAAPGLPGFQNYFLLLTGFALLGMIATLLLSLRIRAGQTARQQG